ncbi:MAG TPA: sugar ABC transporter permease [Candidatus Ornithomonoglobus intestinigallinarum]|uniref:Sugar ABC transporter permease n=1 Tax=Candidatus Ornithomonoglobus intestinigallinarum TaxID=2840894 RepID=A0A9D1H4T0_9FIRM|nr:sugar ABC transporter permease [Candidatus Ornithomonoglobus intestinigallinarum]
MKSNAKIKNTAAAAAEEKGTLGTRIKHTALQYKKHYPLVLMIVPGLIALILFNYLPIYGVTIAFKDFKLLEGITGSDWIGFENFAELFSGTDFLRVLRNTIVISLLKLACGLPAPIILALLLNEVKHTAYKKLIQTFTYMPHFFSWVVLSGIITMIFSTSGPVNSIIQALGGQPLSFFGDSGLFVGLVVGTAVWQSVGWGTIIYMAALSGVDESLYEAAVIDGAGRWKQALYVSVPCILPTIATVFILNLGSVLNAGFDQIYNMYNPTVYEVADIIDTYVLRRLQEMDYGIGTAADLFKSVVGLMFVLGGNWLTKKLSGDEMGIL